MRVFNKKGVALWLSWILLLAFIIVISAFMVNWTSNYTAKHANTMKEIADTGECNFVSLTIDSVCQSSNQLIINMTNRNTIGIDQLIINVYDIYLENPQTKRKNITISPSSKESLTIIKQGTTREIEITPVFFKDDSIIICNGQAIKTNQVTFC